MEAGIHTCTRHPDSVRIIRAVRCLRRVLVSRIVKDSTHMSACIGTAAYCTPWDENAQGMELDSGETESVEYASDERRLPLWIEGIFGYIRANFWRRISCRMNVLFEGIALLCWT